MTISLVDQDAPIIKGKRFTNLQEVQSVITYKGGKKVLFSPGAHTHVLKYEASQTQSTVAK